MHIFYFPSCNYDKLPNKSMRLLETGNAANFEKYSTRKWNEDDMRPEKNESENCFDLWLFKKKKTDQNGETTKSRNQRKNNENEQNDINEIASAK